MGTLQGLHKVLRIPIGTHIVDGRRGVKIQVNLTHS